MAADSRCVAQLINIKRWQGHGIEDTGTRGCSISGRSRIKFCGMGGDSGGRSEPLCVEVCRTGDSAFWANTAVAQYADGDYEAAVTTVDACFGIWEQRPDNSKKSYMRKALNVRARAEYQPEQKQRFTKIT